ncbi:hypothetical protein DPX16_15189 [Anabarilius grahami]|uniref:Uncharacterized protein n=1 Tax=Anabarilius grahami TaxID=495550 RepID=A0A3N0YWK5_ANAGA|nr:hypothetical protein DPX16_15189 [Anabarilius grahami]
MSIPVGVLMESKGMEESHVYTPASEAFLSHLLYQSKPVLRPNRHWFPLVLPLLLLFTPLCCMDLPLVFRPPALPWLMDPLALPWATEPITPPLPIDQSAPPWLTRSSGSALVSHHSAYSTDFQAFDCASSLHPFGSTSPLHLFGLIRLHLPSSSVLDLGPTDTPPVPWLHLGRSSSLP